MAKRTQYYCPFLTPSALPPLLSREFPRTPAGGRWRPPCQRGLAALADWGIPTGCAWPPIPGQPPHAKRGRACPARSLAITTPFILCIVGRGLDPSAGRRGRRPLQHNPQGFSLPQTSAAAWGQAALHPTLPHSVGRAFARNSFTPPRILCIVGRQATGPLHNRPAPSNTKITCLRPLAGRLFLCFKFFLVPFLLRKGTNPRLVKITSGQSPQPRRPAPAGPAGSARPSGR